jgi:hypothetical protein
VKGPYWELFFNDITGIKPPAPASPTLGGPSVDSQNAYEMPVPLDLMAPKVANGAPKPMAGSYTFTLRIKVHIRNEFK